MSERRTNPGRRADAAIVGGGVVGAACALALAQQGLQVTLIEHVEAPAWQSTDAGSCGCMRSRPTTRRLLDAAGVWAAVRDARAQPYRRMRVWDAAGGEELRFDADALGRSETAGLDRRARAIAGRSACGRRCRRPSVTGALPGARGRAGAGCGNGVTLRTGRRHCVWMRGWRWPPTAGDSTLRRTGRSRQENRTRLRRSAAWWRSCATGERSHEDTAWQRFLPTVVRWRSCRARTWPDAANVSSIVWTLPDAEAVRVAGARRCQHSAGELTQARGRSAPRGRPPWPEPTRRVPAEAGSWPDAYVAGRVLVALAMPRTWCIRWRGRA
jgi:2-octaprenyl-3-methyl-6-methoxy-1,4-benzoquinol hydroxylase